MDILITIGVVFAAAVMMQFIGFVWYGPLFGKLWMRLAGKTKEEINATSKKEMNRMYVVSFIGSLAACSIIALWAGSIEGSVVAFSFVTAIVALLLGGGTALPSYMFLQKRNQLALFFVHYSYVAVSIFLSALLIFYSI